MSRTMKAIVYTRYGPPDVLQLREVERPKPREDQVLAKVYAASVNSLDYRRFEKLSTKGHLMEDLVIKSVGKTLGAYIASRQACGADADLCGITPLRVPTVELFLLP